MIGWWILGILLLVILLLCLTRVGVLIRFGEELTVSARFGFEISGASGKKKPPKNEKAGRSAEKADAKEGEAEEGVPEAHAQRHPGGVEGPLAAAEKGAAPHLPGRADRSAGCVHYFRGQAEPADAAQLYGELHGAVWTGMPVLEQLLVIPGRISTWMWILPRRRQKFWEASGFPPGSVRCCGSA